MKMLKNVLVQAICAALGAVIGFLAYTLASVVYIGLLMFIAACTGGMIAGWIVVLCNISCWVLCFALLGGGFYLTYDCIIPGLVEWANRETLPHILHGA